MYPQSILGTSWRLVFKYSTGNGIKLTVLAMVLAEYHLAEYIPTAYVQLCNQVYAEKWTVIVRLPGISDGNGLGFCGRCILCKLHPSQFMPNRIRAPVCYC